MHECGADEYNPYVAPAVVVLIKTAIIKKISMSLRLSHRAQTRIVSIAMIVSE
jgi:hypothetical protein